jgi:hypothetical protein
MTRFKLETDTRMRLAGISVLLTAFGSSCYGFEATDDAGLSTRAADAAIPQPSTGADAGPVSPIACPAPPFDTTKPEFASCVKPLLAAVTLRSAGTTMHVRTTSADGNVWAPESLLPHEDPHYLFPDAFAFGFGYGIYASNSGFFRSADGINWESMPRPVGSGEFSWFGFRQNKFVLLGRTDVRSGAGVGWVSENAEQWRQTPPAGLPRVNGVAVGNGVWVAVGSSNDNCGTGGPGYMISTDGETWSAPVILPGQGEFIDVAFGNGVFFATGDNLCNGASQTVNRSFRMISTDGKIWTDRSDMNSTPKMARIGRPLFLDGVFKMFAEDGLYTTPDGKQFSKVPGVPGTQEQHYVFALGKFVAASGPRGGVNELVDNVWTATSYNTYCNDVFAGEVAK